MSTLPSDNMSVNFVDSSGQEFNDFVGPTPANQNGAPNSTTTKNQNSFFDDFANTTNSSNSNSENTKQTMSKDSIMALFNQRPAVANVTAPVNASNPMFQTQPQGSAFIGGMQIPANFGLGGNLQQQQPQQQQPPLLQGQHFASAQPQPAAAFAALNNPFLGMDSTTNNVS